LWFTVLAFTLSFLLDFPAGFSPDLSESTASVGVRKREYPWPLDRNLTRLSTCPLFSSNRKGNWIIEDATLASVASSGPDCFAPTAVTEGAAEQRPAKKSATVMNTVVVKILDDCIWHPLNL